MRRLTVTGLWTTPEGSLGDPYKESYGWKESPSCGHVYEQQSGAEGYQVQVTAYWNVHWQGIDQEGDIPLRQTASTEIVVGEIQVLNQ